MSGLPPSNPLGVEKAGAELWVCVPIDMRVAIPDEDRWVVGFARVGTSTNVLSTELEEVSGEVNDVAWEEAGILESCVIGSVVLVENELSLNCGQLVIRDPRMSTIPPYGG